MRRLFIYYRRGENRWQQLQPGLHEAACKRPEIRGAVHYLGTHPEAVGIAVRVGDELFNLMVAGPEDCFEFTFPDAEFTTEDT